MCTSSAVGSFSEENKVCDRTVVSREAPGRCRRLINFPVKFCKEKKYSLLLGGLCWRMSIGGEGSLGKVLGNAHSSGYRMEAAPASFLLPGAPPWEPCTVTVTVTSALQQPSSTTSRVSPGRECQEKPRSWECVLFVVLSGHKHNSQ